MRTPGSACIMYSPSRTNEKSTDQLGTDQFENVVLDLVVLKWNRSRLPTFNLRIRGRIRVVELIINPNLVYIIHFP